MAEKYFKFGANGSGDSVNDPGNAEDFLQGQNGWPLLFNPEVDTAAICPGVHDAGGNFIMYRYGSEARGSFLVLRYAGPNEFPGEAGTECKVIIGSAYNHRVFVPKWSYWYTNNPGTKFIVEKIGGDGLGYWQAEGASEFDIEIVVQAQNLSNQGARYANLGNSSNNDLITYRKFTCIHGRNSSNGPGIVIRDSGNRVRVGELTVSISASEGYPTGLLRVGSGSSFDPGNLLHVDLLVVTGAAETDFLVEVGSKVRILHADVGAMRPHHDQSRASLNDFGDYEVGVDNGEQHTGCPQFRIDGTSNGAPTLQGNDLSGAARSIVLFPTTAVNQAHESRAGELFVDELAEHEAAQVRTISFELLLNDALLAAANTRNVWLEVMYHPDGGGRPIRQSTRAPFGAGVALAASEAAWSDVEYLGQTLNKVHLEITTSSLVAPQSVVTAKVYWGVTAASTSDLGVASLRTLQEAA